MAKLRVVALIVDTQKLTLYREDGTTYDVPQGDKRLQPIVDQALPIIQAGGIAEIDVEDVGNSYHEYEKQSGGLTRFFKVAKKAIAHIFGGETVQATETVAPVKAGKLPVGPVTKAMVNEQTASAVQEIIQNAESTATESFQDDQVKEDETVVAVVEDKENGTKKIIPGVEKISGQLRHSVKMGSTKGMEAFFARLAKVIDKRAHSVEDLLRFLERGDLPIADDGSIIAYKVLNYYDKEKNIFADCHTGRVMQRVGSYVCVDEALIDRDRRNECSNGLHIARRGYINGFNGNVCVLTKIAPEDVVTVPHNDPNKVRVCGYHIIALLDADSHQKLRENRPMTDNEKVQKLLGAAISGNHIGKIEEVRIHGQKGHDVRITSLEKAPKLAEKPAPRKVEAIPDPGTEKLDSPVVDPKMIVEQVTPKKPAGKAPVATKPASSSRQEQVKQLYDIAHGSLDLEKGIQAAKDIIELKRKAKVSWALLGLDEKQVKFVMDTSEATIPVAPPASVKPVEAPKPASTKKAAQPAPKPPEKALAKAKKSAPEKKHTPKQAVKPEPVKKVVYSGTKAEQARQMFDNADYKTLWAFKKSAKKSWEALGFNQIDITLIEVNK